jgi:hypothetical protein
VDEDNDSDHRELPTAGTPNTIAWYAASQPVAFPPHNGRRVRLPLAVIGILVILAGLVFADRQSALLGGRVWGPAAQPTVQPSGLTFCTELSTGNRNRIESAAAEMRQTGGGEDLLNLLIDERICVGVEDLKYATAYTGYTGSQFYFRVTSVTVDEEALRKFAPDEAAAVLVHEATHVSRILNKTSCAMTRRCQRLPNGVYVEEEVAAHAAEAQFWIDLHGPEGTQTGITRTGAAGAFYLNKLAQAWEEGPEAFRAFVISVRSSPEENFEENGP